MKLLYILGAGHCGSTLLSMALDQHPDAIAVSELINLNRHQAGKTGNEDLTDQVFWRTVSERYQSVDGRKRLWDIKFDPREATSLRQWGVENDRAIRCIADEAHANVVVDASKHPARLRGLLEASSLDISVIYLMRDARAIVHSYARKYGQFRVGALKLLRTDRQAARLVRKLPEHKWMTLTYEDLSSCFHTALAKVCSQFGLTFYPNMLSPNPTNFIGIGGNRMRYHEIREVKCDTSWTREMKLLPKTAAAVLFYQYNSRLCRLRREFAYARHQEN